jgi:SHS family lactate transporter-like MFS transporter
MTSAQKKTFVASFLGWTLDAFDYFLVIVVVSHLATDFHKTVFQIGFAVTLTLAMRPVGALIFGWIADRYGRRVPLMIDIGLYSVIELLTAFSPNFTVFLVLRVAFGLAMGGEWGLGSALAMESLPPNRRGLFSGILQEGYAVGNLLAGLALAWIFPYWGWRGMFVVGALPAFLIFYIRAHVPESEVWLAGKHERLGLQADILWTAVKRYWPLFGYGMVLMAAFNFLSHGSQDPYPTFLGKQLGFDVRSAGYIVAIASVGAIVGGVFFGWLSQGFGRRAAIVVASIVGLAVIPVWAFNHTWAMVALGGSCMQFAVQGAWGIIPAHLNEIAPNLVRGTFPGTVYQLGNLIASGTLQIVTLLATGRFVLPSGAANYASAMAVFVAVAFIAVIVMTLLGRFVTPEHRDEEFTALPSV